MTSKVGTTTIFTGGPLCGGPKEHTLLSILAPRGFGPASSHSFGCLFVPAAVFTLHLSIHLTCPPRPLTAHWADRIAVLHKIHTGETFSKNNNDGPMEKKKMFYGFDLFSVSARTFVGH